MTPERSPAVQGDTARPQKPGTPPPGSETTADAMARSHGAHAQTGTWWKLPEATNWGDRAKIRGFCSKGNVRVATPGDFRVTGHSGQASDPRSARLWAEAWERRPRRCHQSERRGLPGGAARRSERRDAPVHPARARPRGAPRLRPQTGPALAPPGTHPPPAPSSGVHVSPAPRATSRLAVRHLPLISFPPNQRQSGSR